VVTLYLAVQMAFTLGSLDKLNFSSLISYCIFSFLNKSSFYFTFGAFVYSIFMITVQMILLIPNNSNLDETYQYFLDMGMDEL